MSSYAIMTNVGRNKEAAALANGTSLAITEIAWGDGDRAPGGGETALLNEVGRKQVQGNGLVPDTLNTAFFEILLDANDGPFVIREAGLFDVDGDLIALAKYDPPVNKPKDTVTALVRINVVFSDLENLILNVQSTDAYVPVERKTSTGVGLLGGGDLSEDRTLAVDFASEAEAVAGARIDKVMSPALVAAVMSNLLDGAPGALDTLNELAAALGDDPNFAATITAALGTKLSMDDINNGDLDARYHRKDEWWGNFGRPGYQRLPSGLILQWGFTNWVEPAGAVYVEGYFPVVFPNYCAMVVTGNRAGGGASPVALGWSPAKMWAYIDEWAAIANGGDITYLAVGN